MSEINEIFDTLFNGRKARQSAPPKTPAPTTKDSPNIKLFMLQMINAFASFIERDSMQWVKTYRNKDNGKEYTVTITLEEKV